MTPELPDILDRYFRAQNAHDIPAQVACFAEDATVRDEGKDLAGIESIRAWAEETRAKYRITAEPLEYRMEDGATVVRARITGTFTGSPITLDFHFRIAGKDRIAALEVH